MKIILFILLLIIYSYILYNLAQSKKEYTDKEFKKAIRRCQKNLEKYEASKH